MSSLPLVFDGQLVGIDQLSGINYVHGYPEIMTRMARHVQDTAKGYALAPTFIYPFPGRQRVYAQTGRSWLPGTRLRAYRGGNTGDWRTVLVHAYDPATGVLDLEVVASNNFETAKIGAQSWFFTPSFYETVGTSVAAVTTAGTSGYDVDSARKGIAQPTNKDFQVWFADFIHNENFVSLVDNSGTTTEDPVQDSVFSGAALEYDFSDAPGVFRFSGGNSGGNTTKSLQIGRNYLHDWTDFSGTKTLFETRLCIPAFTPGFTNYFRMEAGLIGANAKVCFQWQAALNVGRFQVLHGINNSFSTLSSTTALVAATFYTLRAEIVGSNIVMSVDGTSIATFSAANYKSVSSSNRMTPMVRSTCLLAGDEANIDVDYIYYRKQFTSGR